MEGEKTISKEELVASLAARAILSDLRRRPGLCISAMDAETEEQVLGVWALIIRRAMMGMAG